MSDCDFGIAAMPKLQSLRSRMYCLWQASMSDELCDDHWDYVADEICSVWECLNRVILSEQQRLRNVEEEMRKFEQGFAYRPRRD